MSHAFAWVAVLAWGGAALVATPIAGWRRLRAGPRDRAFLVLAVFQVSQLAWLGWIAVHGIHALLERSAGARPPAWLGWTIGFAGLTSLVSALRSGPGGKLRRDPNRATALACGLFGLGYLLQEIARAVQSGSL
jgi:hypothetical protein